MSSEFAETYKTFSTEQLFQIVHVDHASYRPEAVEAARVELATRDDLPDVINLNATLSSFEVETAEPGYRLNDSSLRLIPLFLPGIGLWIAVFQSAKKRKERAKLAWTWWCYGVLLRLGLVLFFFILVSLRS